MNPYKQSAPAVVRFEGNPIQLIDMGGQVWVRGAEIGRALGYSNPALGIYLLFKRNAEEFSEEMTCVVPMADLDPQIDSPEGGLDYQPDSPGQVREVRLFSHRGAHLLGMLARTKKAQEFRHWVLDVLEHACAARVQQPLTLGEELRCIRLSVWLMEKVEAARGLERAEELYLRLMRVNRRLGMPTMAFSALALNWRQGELPLGAPDSSAGAGH